jgi:peptide-methionine (R)-S-oxide reductase
MRIPRLPNILRSFIALGTVSASTRYLQTRTTNALTPTSTTTILKSMPTIPFLSSFFGTSSASSKMSYPDNRSDDEWRAVLNKGMPHLPQSPHQHTNMFPEQFRILREKGTEAPFSSPLDKHSPTSGVYTCAACNAPLYKANHKFKSGCGWPAYFDSLPGAVTRHTDSSFGMARTEIVCSNCGGHLGHVFKGEGYNTPTDERHCVNGVSITFHDEPKEGEGEKK